jgi:hypothetical protein
MKEQDVIDLGFDKEFDYSFGGEYHYYVYDFSRGLSLISNANDETINGEWYVYIFEEDNARFEDNVRFTNKKDLELLINLLNKNKNLQTKYDR